MQSRTLGVLVAGMIAAAPMAFAQDTGTPGPYSHHETDPGQYFRNPIFASEVLDFHPGEGTKDNKKTAIKSLGGPWDNILDGPGYFAYATTLGRGGKIWFRLSEIACSDGTAAPDLVIHDASIKEPYTIEVRPPFSKDYLEINKVFKGLRVEIDLDEFSILSFYDIKIIAGKKGGTGGNHEGVDPDYLEGRPCPVTSSIDTIRNF